MFVIRVGLFLNEIKCDLCFFFFLSAAKLLKYFDKLLKKINKLL